MQEIEYNDPFRRALHLLESTNELVFLTGKAGTGKSTLLMLFQKKTKKNVVVLAPTGVAALNVKGMTIHSFFGFHPGITVEKAASKGRKLKDTALLHSTDMIIIDEISMVRADLLDSIDAFLRAALKTQIPFGGMRMVFIGDLYQLPPVILSQEKPYFDELYKSPYFFSAKAMENTSFALVELEKIYRQNDHAFITVLNAIRENSASDEQLAFINQRVLPINEREGKYIYLTATNKDANQINEEKLQKLPGKLYSFTATTDGDVDPSLNPTDRELKLKIGAQVMLLTNNPEGLWVNGTVGTIEDISSGKILIETQEGRKFSVTHHEWPLYEYRVDETTARLIREETGTFTQYPLCLAWGITIHKAQGKTFDQAIVDLSRAFAAGQAYVALSRCRSFDGLILKSPVKKRQILIDQHVVEFFKKFAVKQLPRFTQSITTPCCCSNLF